MTELECSTVHAARRPPRVAYHVNLPLLFSYAYELRLSRTVCISQDTTADMNSRSLTQRPTAPTRSTPRVVGSSPPQQPVGQASIQLMPRPQVHARGPRQPAIVRHFAGIFLPCDCPTAARRAGWDNCQCERCRGLQAGMSVERVVDAKKGELPGSARPWHRPKLHTGTAASLKGLAARTAPDARA